MGEKTVQNQCVECNDYAWTDGSQHECKIYSNPFLYGIRILNGVIAQRKMLVIWFDSIKGIETKNEDSVQDLVSRHSASTTVPLSGKEPHINKA